MLPKLIWVMDPWTVAIPEGVVLSGVSTEEPAVVAVARVLAALAEVLCMQPHEQMRMIRMLAGRLL